MSSNEPQSNHDQGLCAMCKDPGLQRCSECKAIKYCSKSCQKLDWPVHKIICKTFKDFSDNHRPDHDYVRAIHFPQASDKPIFFWLRDHRHTSSCDTAHGDIPMLEDLLGPPNEDKKAVSLSRNPVLDRDINRIEIVGNFCEADRAEEISITEANNSVRKIDKELQDAWFGEIVAYGGHRRDGDLYECYGLDPLDFRYAVDAMRLRYDEAIRERAKNVQGPSVLGVRMANVADNNQAGCGCVAVLPVSVSQCLSESDIETPICNRIGIPLVLRRLPLSLTGRDRLVGKIPGPIEQVGLIVQLRFLNPLMSMWDFRHGIGSAIAVRKDGQPLHKMHMVAFIDYGVHVVEQYQGHAYKLENVDMCSKEHFLTW